MTTPLSIRPDVSLDDALQASLAALVGRQRTLEDVLAWMRVARPMPQIVDVVVQDEYTHDVVIDLQRADGLVLVYDTT